jgi:hypothetical protein
LECGADAEVVQSIKSYSNAPLIPDCGECGEPMARHFTPLMMSMDFEPFVSTIDGTIINSRSARREHMLKHGVVQADEIAQDIPRYRQRILDDMKKDAKKDIAESLMMVEQGYKPRIDSIDNIIPGAAQ